MSMDNALGLECDFLCRDNSMQPPSVIPNFFLVSDEDKLLLANGSSAFAQCSRLGTTDVIRCDGTTSDVLFITTFLYSVTLMETCGQEGYSQLEGYLYLHAQSILFYFTDMPDYRGIRRIELVMFNCPKWRIGAERIRVLLSRPGSSFVTGVSISPAITSCNSLVRVCIPQFTSMEIVSIGFSFLEWVHIAEVIFYGAGSSSICPPDIIITPTPDTTNPQTPDTRTPPNTTTPPQSILSMLL
jgi:hypothetical protein